MQIWTTVKSKRQGALENGEIDTRDAYQQEIYCSWPELFDAPADLAEQLNKNFGYLQVAPPGMPMGHWAQAVNDLKRQLMIPGQVRQRELHWDGVDIGDLMRKLRVLEAYGTVDIYNLPGYEIDHPAVLTCDVTGNCLLDNTVHGRQIARYTGRIASIDDILHYEAIARKRLRYQMMTPATVARAGYELHGIENMPERTEVMRRIPDDGPALLRSRCVYCGTAVKVRGEMRDGRPHYEVDTTPVCPHLQLRIKQYPDGDGGFFDRLHIYHWQEPRGFLYNRKTEAERRVKESQIGSEIDDSALRSFLHNPPAKR